jgi:hypothetical protein
MLKCNYARNRPLRPIGLLDVTEYIRLDNRRKLKKLRNAVLHYIGIFKIHILPL